jgi:hypothetical protein
MFAVTLTFAILSSGLALFVCRIFVRQILLALRTGQWRARTGVADRSISPKTFWFFLFSASGYALAVAAAACFLFVVALTKSS